MVLSQQKAGGRGKERRKREKRTKGEKVMAIHSRAKSHVYSVVDQFTKQSRTVVFFLVAHIFFYLSLLKARRPCSVVLLSLLLFS